MKNVSLTTITTIVINVKLKMAVVEIGLLRSATWHQSASKVVDVMVVVWNQICQLTSLAVMILELC